MKLLCTYSLKQFLSRALTALSFILLLTLANSDLPFTDINFYTRVDFPILLLCFLTLFLILCCISRDQLIHILLLICATGYCALSAYQEKDFLFACGLCLLLSMAVIYFYRSECPIPSPKGLLWPVCGLLILAYTLSVGITCCMYYRSYWTSCYDFGIFSQMFYYMKETGQMLTTCERDGLLSHFAVHFSPLYYLLLPVYWLFPTPETLLIAQPFIVSIGIIPLVLICRRHKLSDLSSLAFSVCYLLYPGFFGGCYYYLHENCFLAPLLLWFIYFIEAENSLASFIFAALTLFVKEDAPVYIATVALYFIVSQKSIFNNTIILLLSISYFISVTALMNQFGEGIMSDSRYGDYIYDDGGLTTVIKAVIQNPAFAIHQIFRQEKLIFILQLLAPLAFLPVIIKRPSGLILLIPVLLINLMTSYCYQYDIGFQYTFGSGSLLIYLALVNYASLGTNRNKILLCGVLSSIVIFFGGHYSKFEYMKEYQDTYQTRQDVEQGFSLIPENASVAASTFFVPNLSQRDVIYELDTTENAADYIVLDLRVNTSLSMHPYQNDNYEMIYYRENSIVIYRAK